MAIIKYLLTESSRLRLFLRRLLRVHGRCRHVQPWRTLQAPSVLAGLYRFSALVRPGFEFPSLFSLYAAGHFATIRYDDGHFSRLLSSGYRLRNSHELGRIFTQDGEHAFRETKTKLSRTHFSRPSLARPVDLIITRMFIGTWKYVGTRTHK